MMLGVDPKIDYAFRKLFATEANSDLLIDLLHAVLNPPPDQRIVAVEILNPFNDKDTETDKETILDIKARDTLDRQYNVEMEMCPSWTFPSRALYYWAVLHAGQLAVGEGYELLRPTFSICFVNRPLFPALPDYHLEFRLRSLKYPQLVFSPDQAIHVVELPKFNKTIDEVRDPFDAWCYFLRNGESLDPDNLPGALSAASVPRAIEVLKMLKQTEIDWHRYQSQLKTKRDRDADLRESKDEGRAEGLAEGRAEGRAKGDAIGRIQLSQRMMKLPVTPVDELLKESHEELLAKADALEQELAKRIGP